MAQVHLVVGSTGAGKSTYSKAWAKEHGVVRLAIDEWMWEAPDAAECAKWHAITVNTE